MELLDITHAGRLCGLPRPEALEGRSLVPLLKQRAAWEKPAIRWCIIKTFWVSRCAPNGARHGVGRRQDGVELYDPQMTRMSFHLASNPRYAGVVTKMKRLLPLEREIDGAGETVSNDVRQFLFARNCSGAAVATPKRNKPV